MKYFRRFSCLLLLCLTMQLSVFSARAFDESPVQAILRSYEAEAPVNISAFHLTESELEPLVEQVLNSGDLPWYAANTYAFTYDQDTGTVLYFHPQFLDEETYDYARYEQRVREIIDDCIREGMSQWQQALVIHDYLVANCRYDESYTYSTGYDLLVSGTAVCRGYAEAYMDILNRLGIPCCIVSSDDMDHCWNLVSIDGSWYHVDVTWDDSAPDSYGLVLHDYLFVTDQEMQADHQSRLKADDFGHYNWETDITCTDTRFADAFWKGVDSQICYPEAELSYLRRTDDWNCYLYARNENTGEETLLFTDEVEYIRLGQGQSYAYPHSGLSLWNGWLYFSSVDTVYAIAPDGSEVVEVYSHDTEENGAYIFSSFVVNDTVYLTLADHDFNYSTMEIALPSTDYHIHSYRHTVIDPTCLEDGLDIYACDCGIYLEMPGEDARFHDYETTVILNPTLWEKGRQQRCCVVCGDTFYSDISRLTFWEWLLEFLHIP